LLLLLVKNRNQLLPAAKKRVSFGFEFAYIVVSLPGQTGVTGFDNL
jgi:hypothetical protein